MAIKVVPITTKWNGSYSVEDCIVLRTFERESTEIDLCFPFDEDTRNMSLTFSEAASLRNSIDELLDTKMLEKPRGI